VALVDVGANVVQGQTGLHVFAMGVGWARLIADAGRSTCHHASVSGSAVCVTEPVRHTPSVLPSTARSGLPVDPWCRLFSVAGLPTATSSKPTRIEASSWYSTGPNAACAVSE
jgi:hypothetical protein